MTWSARKIALLAVQQSRLESFSKGKGVPEKSTSFVAGPVDIFLRISKPGDRPVASELGDLFTVKSFELNVV